MNETETLKSNVPEFSVGELALSLKRTIEENFGRVRVRGELSRVSIAGSGHMYSALKDDKAVIDAICWKGTLAKLPIKPEEGLEVICVGRLSTYPARSNYQLIIESMELAGEGALLKMLEERKKKLTAEGLFAPECKQNLPFLPKTIGVVTSPTGSVIRDILHRLRDRFPRHVLVWPALVQGKGAAEQVAAGIDGFNAMPEGQKPDVIIVARGGGSLEDLMPFNEENVVRAVAQSRIPIISAVGHETDTTLCDLASDYRAPTPTGAAEVAVPVRAQVMAQILDDEKRLLNALTRMIGERKTRIEAASARLGDPAKLLEFHTQKLDHTGAQLTSKFKEHINTKSQNLLRTAARLRSPADRLREAKNTLARWQEQLKSLAPKITENPAQKLKHASGMLEAYSFENVLKRGYVVVQNNDGALVSDPAAPQTGEALSLRFAGRKFVDVVVGDKNIQKTISPKKTSATVKKTPIKKKKSDSLNQHSLF